MTVAGKLDGLFIIIGTHSSRNCQALTGLYILDLKNAAYVVNLPGARRMTVAGKLDGPYIILGAHSSRNCQALTGLYILDLKNAPYVVYLPGARPANARQRAQCRPGSSCAFGRRARYRSTVNAGSSCDHDC
jgi:hypothetical protein